MATRDLHKIEVERLESLIDNYGLSPVLEALSEICDAKAEHIRANWQDDTTAKAWAEMCGHIGIASTHASKRGM